MRNLMRRGTGDFVPLNIPTEAIASYPQAGWLLGADGNWYWSGPGSPNLTIPISSGPGIPSNAGWVTTSTGSLVWTGPGTTPAVLPGSIIPPNPTVNIPPAAQGPLLNWTPQPLLPDSMLPAPLQRTNPLVCPAQWIPNKYDFDILRRAQKWKWIAANGGLKSCCRIPELGAPIYDTPPWLEMPVNAVPITGEMAALPLTSFQTGGVFTGADVEIINIQVPDGYDGVINRFVPTLNGVNGYTDFSGSIVWRLKYGVRYAKTLGNVTNTFDSFQNSLLVPGVKAIQVISGQTIQVFANIPANSPVGGAPGYVGAGIFGWWYPRR